MKDQAFRFKQFSVVQNKCAMKVNTDGVLLGAWANVSVAKRILDIGTGTGVIALMMAQRNNEAIIDAIDIDQGAYLQAKENVEQSPWRERLNVFDTPLQKFEPGLLYDLIISNPPYFVNDFKSGNAQKDVARHSITLSYEDLLAGINRLLAPAGRANLVLPVFNLALLQTLSGRLGLFVSRLCEVTAVDAKPPYLALIQLERGEKEIEKTVLCIQNGQGDFTEQYKQVAKDFYLKF